ncbi:MAG TPA: hypothetical protein DCE23_08295 [Firmicutes bacterium]|nr:hypothetical protein [Bacillota bacterium]
MEKNDNIDIMITNKYTLSERVLNQLIDRIKRETGINVICYETHDGYIFKDEKYQIPIGDIRFNMRGGEYQKLEIYSGGVSEVAQREHRDQIRQIEQNKKARHRRRFALQVGRTIAATAVIAVVSLGALKYMGIIDTPEKPHTPTIDTVVVAQEHNINTINTASDVILVEWANYAMGQVRDICSESEYEYFETLSDDTYSDYFAPVMSSYYNYLDYKDADLPIIPEYGDRDIVASSHQTFRNNLVTFANYLHDSDYFSKISFSSSPFANAVVTDKEGNILEAGAISGELVGTDGSTITSEDKYSIKVRLTDLKNTEYSLDNLPPDATIIDGEVYVDSSCIYNQSKTITK